MYSCTLSVEFVTLPVRRPAAPLVGERHTIIIYVEKWAVEEVVLVIVVDSLHLVGNKFYATRRGGI